MVANLPYAVAATVVLDYFQKFAAMQSATVMVQREVAERMAAKPGTKNYGAYTVKLSLYTHVEGSFAVAPGNFLPAPRVESSVIRLARRKADDPLYAKFFNEEETQPQNNATSQDAIESDDGRLALLRAAAAMADASFASRRKTIANSCKTYFGARDKSIIDHLPKIFDAAGVDSKTRGETLLATDYLRMGAELIRARREYAG
jgi:16S rRNA (adenine1518-N6/adenine1519-N6)-dimethyltransferase